MKIITTGRDDLKDYWKLSGALTRQKLPHTPFLVFLEEDDKVEVRVVDNITDLLTYPDETKVMNQWTGTWRSDFFKFTVGEARDAYSNLEPEDY